MVGSTRSTFWANLAFLEKRSTKQFANTKAPFGIFGSRGDATRFETMFADVFLQILPFGLI